MVSNSTKLTCFPRIASPDISMQGWRTAKGHYWLPLPSTQPGSRCTCGHFLTTWTRSNEAASCAVSTRTRRWRRCEVMGHWTREHSRRCWINGWSKPLLRRRAGVYGRSGNWSICVRWTTICAPRCNWSDAGTSERVTRSGSGVLIRWTRSAAALRRGYTRYAICMTTCCLAGHARGAETG